MVRWRVASRHVLHGGRDEDGFVEVGDASGGGLAGGQERDVPAGVPGCGEVGEADQSLGRLGA
jgi:hypothetical protein